MDPREAVQLFRIRVRDALLAGVADPHPQVRWWSIQLLDHLADPSVVPALSAALDDPVPRVRRNAAHALGCRVGKPSGDGVNPGAVNARLAVMAASDPNAKVRAEAARALEAVRSDVRS